MGNSRFTGVGNWVSQYQTQQFIEIGLNLTRIGVDPALYSTLSPCQSLFANIFFKSRSSNSFTSNMQDFMMPLVFLRPPVMDYAITPDTLRCNRKTGTILITNNSTMGNYTWKTIGGTISGASTDSSQLNITTPGKYIVSSSPADGCPATRIDTVIIPIDTFPPVASINVSWVGGYTPFSYFQLHGGDLAASNYSTPFGGSAGLLWNWNGPNGFASTIQDPVTAGSYWGIYNLTVTEKRNGCVATASKTVDFYDFALLEVNTITLTGKVVNGKTELSWLDLRTTDVKFYEIERSVEGGSGFSKIGYVNGDQDSHTFDFADYQPLNGQTSYRIKSIGADGKIAYSKSIQLTTLLNRPAYAFIKNDGGQTVRISLGSKSNGNGKVSIYSTSGQEIGRTNIQLSNQTSIIDLPAGARNAGTGLIFVVSVNDRIVDTQKMIL